MRQDDTRTATCRCGEVVLHAAGDPIAAVTCFCNSCRAAARAIERLPGAPAVANSDGGVEYVIVRKDRISCRQGCDLLAERRERPGGPTRRVVATCCNSLMFLDFTKGHWLNLCCDRLPALERPPITAHVMTRDLKDAPPPPAGVPQAKALPPELMVKLIRAWIGMGFASPRINFVHRTLDA